MLSILIPNYNQKVVKLVKQLLEQVKENGCFAEIIVGDDASDEEIYKFNMVIEGWDRVKMIKQNIQLGRAGIRNMLADEAKYDKLLFIDSDAIIINSDFLRNYLELNKDSLLINGGVSYADTSPDNSRLLLRWKYGKKKEERSASFRNKNPYASFSTFNFFIEKKLFQSIRFNENLTDYGHEDTLLGFELKKRNIPVLHIDNSLMHIGLEENDVFLQKTRTGLESLHILYTELNFNPSFQKEVTLLRSFNLIKKFGLVRITKLKFQLFRKFLENNLTGKSPSVFIFQLYKLGYYCTIADK